MNIFNDPFQNIQGTFAKKIMLHLELVIKQRPAEAVRKFKWRPNGSTGSVLWDCDAFGQGTGFVDAATEADCGEVAEQLTGD